MKDAAILKVVEANEVEIPRAMVDDEIDRMANELDQQLRYQGMGLNQYLEFVGKNIAEFREELRPEAEKSVKTRIVLMGVAAAEALQVTDEEREEELKAMAAQYQMEVEKIKSLIGEENLGFLTKDLQVKKAIDFISEYNAGIKKPVITPRHRFFQLAETASRMRDKLKETQELENREVTFEGGILVWNYQDSRLQVFFNKIPEESKRRELKSSGFHWSPKNRAWQRQLNPNAVSAAKRILNLQNI